jgi:hypothetical protein
MGYFSIYKVQYPQSALKNRKFIKALNSNGLEIVIWGGSGE